MGSVNGDFIQAIGTGDIPALKDCISRHPEDLNTPFNFGDGHGYAMNLAAARNRPEVIEYLVLDCHQDVNRQGGVSGEYTPLHHAKKFKAYAAAAALLSLGADPSRQTSDHDNTVDFCRSAEVQSLIDPRFVEKAKARRRAEIQAKAEGAWTLTTPREVMHDRELAESRCRLTDVFNFETRTWRSIVRDLDGAGTAHSMVFFDDIPDQEFLRPALLKLKELGGKAGEDEIKGGPRLNKGPMLRPAS